MQIFFLNERCQISLKLYNLPLLKPDGEFWGPE
jgi:hypothetical protein